jgi:hypothetical protein
MPVRNSALPGDGQQRPPSPIGWAGNALEPVYVWGNTMQGGVRELGSQHTPVQKGRDILEAAKTGYTPFVYPHPLVSGAPDSGGSQNPFPAAPTNLKVQ